MKVTFMGLLAITGIIIAILLSILAYKRYMLLKKIRSHAKIIAQSKLDIFLFPFYTLIFTAIVWGLTMAILSLCYSGDTYVQYSKLINDKEQLVEFQEQKDDLYIISVDGINYNCKKIVIDNTIDRPQVVYTKVEISNNFVYFFFYELLYPVDLYELHIPASYISSTD